MKNYGLIFIICLVCWLSNCGSNNKVNVTDNLPPPPEDFIPPPPVDLGGIPEGTIDGELLSLTLAGQLYRFRWIPPGSFTMGTDDDPSRFFTNSGGGLAEMEAPEHIVSITKGFWMLETEVSQDQWFSQMGTSPSNIKGGSIPVVNIQYADIVNAKGFFDRLHTQTIRVNKFLLPTEAQWEYAYRAGTTTRFYWGDDFTSTIIGDNCWYSANSGNTLHPVGQKAANPWNLLDMSGNAYEIVSDFASFYTSSTQVDPSGPATGTIRVYRGGSYKSNAANCRSTNRILDQQLIAHDNQGFRFILIPD
jgi:formylglycine-generating enzyme required for sulfatase activity